MPKNVRLTIILMLISFIMASCSQKENESKHDNKLSRNMVFSSIDKKIYNKVIIYGIDTKTGFITPINRAIDDDVSLENILLLVVEELSDIASINILNVIEEDDNLTIDFYKSEGEKTPFGKIRRVGENEILDCISYTIFENFEQYKRIFFTINGETYNTDKIKLSEGEPFIVNE